MADRHSLRRTAPLASLLAVSLLLPVALAADPPAAPAGRIKRTLAVKDATAPTDLLFIVNPEAPFEVRMSTEDGRAGYVEGERFRVVVTATKACYITVLSWGPDGSIEQVAPAKATTGSDDPIFLEAGARLTVPQGSAAFRAQPPHGETNLRVFATATPLLLRLPTAAAPSPTPAPAEGDRAADRNLFRELLGQGRGSTKDIGVDDASATPLDGKDWTVADLFVMTGSDRADLATRMGVSEEDAVKPVTGDASSGAAPTQSPEVALRERPARKNPNPPVLANLGSAASDEYLARWERVVSGQSSTKAIGVRFVAPPPMGGRQMPRFGAGPTPQSVDLLVVRAAPAGSKAIGGAGFVTEVVPLVPPGSKSVGGDDLLERRTRELQADPTVRAVIPNRTWQAFAAQAEEAPDQNIFRGLQWHLNNQVKSGNDIDWFVTATDLVDITPAIIGMVDQGIHANDPRLRRAIAVNENEVAGNGVDDDGNGHVDDVDGWNFASDSATLATADDAFNHGSYCTSIIAGGALRTPGYFFPIAYDPKVVVAACMAWDEAAGTATGSLQATLEAIEYAMLRGARVINLSLGGPSTKEELAALAKHPLFDELERRNVLLVIAAGNENIDIDRNPVSPAGLDRPNTIVVMAVDPDGRAARAYDPINRRWEQYSNWGRNQVHIAAPGTMILGIPAVDTTSYGNGTSYAAPIVTGAAAILFGKHPDWDAATVKRAILESARPVVGLDDLCLTGGVLDLKAALEWTP